MNLFHLIWMLFLVLWFVLSIWIDRGFVWGITLFLSIGTAYFAVAQYWHVLFFIPITGIFIISIMWFIKEMIGGNLY